MIKRGIIYKVTSPSGKIYIGQTTKTLGQRRYKHFEYVNRHPDLMTKWACALRKYGNRLIWEVVKDNVPVQDLDKEEIAAIIEYDSFESGYNGTLGGGGSNGRKLSDKTKSIIAEKATGRKASRATRTKMSKSRKGRKMPKSDQHCINISKSKSTGGYKTKTIPMLN